MATQLVGSVKKEHVLGDDGGMMLQQKQAEHCTGLGVARKKDFRRAEHLFKGKGV